ncbi:N-acetylglucosamine kinase [Caproiciproducens galactitolivorans]|uniref:ATPase n=1 Tax=Caproiciproducens galactitolivorans TaxID=642589 RepID=A0ABT4BWB9_9FIRM|nr:BadF/BadG/BcrA/BcrD ATPase family protein [Caproiciproducens galactitolivorans]MCY1715182.1 ATPase [Caproiciproducens galactitolivorans]
MYYLGIDGGGTKTAFEIIDDKGNIVSSCKTATCSYLQIGKENYGKVVQEGAADVCAKANIRVSDIDYSCVGIPSFGETSSDTPDLVNITRSALQSGNVECVNDVVVAWAGSLACEPGINLLAGTGSMGYGMDQKNHAVRSGGWGHLFGDEGSAYWLGKKLIELFTKQADGRVEKGKTYEIVCEEFGLTSDFDFISAVYNKLEFKRDEIAKLQLLLCKAAEQGDHYAIDLYRQAAYELSLIVSAIINQLEFDKDKSITVSYSGGIFKAGELIFAPLKEYMSSYNITLKKPLLSPVTGAALYALVSHTSYKNKSIIDNLYRQEKEL